MAIFGHFLSPGHKELHILAKTENLPKPRLEVVVNTPGNISTKEQVIWSICVGCYNFALEVAAPKKQHDNAKNQAFGPYFAQFCPILIFFKDQ